VAYLFGEFELDTEAFELRRRGVVVEVQPKVFDLLRFLVEHAGRIVSKQELLDEVWPDEHVSESALAFSLTHVRKALGQPKGADAPLETVHRRGYRFVAEVREKVPPLAPLRSVGLTPPPLSLSPEPFVGRGESLGALGVALQAAVGGHGGLALVTGEAGAGKTRLARELADQARDQGVAVWVGRAVDDEAAPVFWPWIAALRQAADDEALGAPSRERLGALVAELVALQAADDSEPGRFWVLARLGDRLREVARTVPVLIVLEDLQWADEASCKLCRSLARELGELRVLLLVTVRQDEARAYSLRKLLGETSVHALGRLTPEEVAQYLERAIGTPPDAAVAEALWAVTGGLPLALQETLRLLVARHGAAALGALSSEEIRLLETAGSVLRARLQLLDETTRALLRVASVLGARFAQATLERMLGPGAPDLLPRLDEAIAQRFLVATAIPGTYAFVHALLRDALYDELPVAERVRWHGAAADALEPQALDGPRIQELVGHLRKAAPGGDEDRRRLSGFAQRAARAARHVGAHADAARFYDWAYEAETALAVPDVRRRAELLVSKGRSLLLSGQMGEGRRAFKQAIELAEGHRFTDLLVKMGQYLRPTFLWAGLRDDLARRTLEAALACAEPTDLVARASVLAALSCTPPHSLGPDHGKGLSEQALELARRSGEPRVHLDALRARLATLTGPEDVEALLAAADELLGVEAGNPRSWPAAEARQARMLAFMQRGAVERVDAELDEFGRIAERLGLAEPAFNYERMRLQRRLQQGHYAEARRGYEALWARAERMELRYAVFLRAMCELELCWDLQGERAVAESPEVFAGLAQFAAINDYHRAVWVDAGASGGKPDVVRSAFEELVARLDALVHDAQYTSTLAHLARAALALGDRERAVALHAALSPFAALNTTNLYYSTLGSVEHFLGELCTMLERPDEAAHHLTRALSSNVRMGLAICALRSKVALGQLWRRERSTRARAERMLTEARAEADALGTTAPAARPA
jgi:DNA-binding winged helix-turn-helix (wHTH) protein/tetratricopeptide (TPR) repeat protein